ncbi:MAG: hypothetical protein ACHQIM_14950 [Sphingobacteriales bacterium]
MKNSFKYLKLWQKMRSGLPVTDDQQADWLDMQALLDQQMPVIATDSEKPAKSKRFKLLSVMFVSLSAAAMTYVVTNVMELNKHHTYNNHQKYKTYLHKESASISGVPNSTSAGNTANRIKDSLLAAPLQAATQKAGIVKPGLSEKSATNTSAGKLPDKNSAVSVSKNKLTAANGPNNNQSAVTPAMNIHSGNKVAGASLAGNKLTHRDLLSGDKSVRRNSAGSVVNTNHNLQVPGRSGRSANHHPFVNEIKQNIADKEGDNPQIPALFSSAPPIVFNGGGNSFQPLSIRVPDFAAIQKQLSNGLQGNSRTNVKTKNAKETGSKNPSPLNIDWGLLAGVNSSGSFTPKNQNSNFYGSLPVDLYFGLYGTYNLNSKWGINSQVQIFGPQTITGAYTHANQSKVDSGQTLKITDSWKRYAVNVPIYIRYKVTGNIGVMAGPVLNFPVKQVYASSTLQPAGIKADSAYYAKVTGILNATKYDQKLNFGFSGGLNIQFKRLSIEATYLKSLSGYQATSGFGSHTYGNGTFQFTLGFRLNKLKP